MHTACLGGHNGNALPVLQMEEIRGRARENATNSRRTKLTIGCGWSWQVTLPSGLIHIGFWSAPATIQGVSAQTSQGEECSQCTPVFKKRCLGRSLTSLASTPSEAI
jgi:hypothetical protein